MISMRLQLELTAVTEAVLEMRSTIALEEMGERRRRRWAQVVFRLDCVGLVVAMLVNLVVLAVYTM